MARIGPVILSVAGDAFVCGARLLAILWEGASTAGDTARVNGRLGSDATILWAGRANDTQTYQGANFGTHGVHAPDGFRLSQISSGRVLVYLRED